MQRRNLLKKIGVAGIATGFSTTAQAGDVTLETRKPSKSTVESYLNSEPVKNISEKVGPRFNVQEGKNTSGQINIEGKPEENQVFVDTKEPIIHTVRLETNVGILGLTLQNDDVIQAILAFDRNVGKGWMKRITSAETVSTRHQMVIGTVNRAIYARPTTEEENREIQRHVSQDIQKALLIEKDTDIYYKLRTNSNSIIIDKQSGDIVEKKPLKVGAADNDSNGDVTVFANNCEDANYAGCMYDITNTSAYCTLAGYACTLTGVSGPQNIVACLAVMAKLCGGSLFLFKISGACEEVARCVKDYCEQNDCSITTPIVPTP